MAADDEKHHLSHRVTEQRTQRLRNLLIDIQELADRASNSLKIIGDAFYSRVYRALSNRLGLSDWEKQVDTKIRSVEAIYGYMNDHAQHQRHEILEWIVIILILLEVVIGVIEFYYH